MIAHSVIGFYVEVDSLLGAVKALRDAHEIRTISPVPLNT